MMLDNRLAGSSVNTATADRLRDPYYLATASTDAEANSGISGWFASNTTITPRLYGGNPTAVYCFGRAPGFFDEVCYTGTGAPNTLSHNLGVAPELIILKRRNGIGDWPVYCGQLETPLSKVIYLNQTGSAQTSSNTWQNITTTTFGFNATGYYFNGNGDTYVAYLFATCPGVSKVGAYTGTAASQAIDCGFAAGARFVMIKRTDGTGDWYTYDTARGMSSGSDPYILLNSTAAQITGTNYVNSTTGGFTLTASAPAALNGNGATYIYLAIA